MDYRFGKIRHQFLLALVIIGSLSACRQIETITTERTVRVDTVRVPVPVPGWQATAGFAVGDSLFYEDDRIRLRVVPVPADSMPNDEGQTADRVPIGDGKDADSVTASTRYRVDVQVKDDTLQAKVPEKTITEKTDRTRYIKQMPSWGWMLIGGLAMLALILIAVFKIRR